MLLILAVLLPLCACQGNFGEISLQDAMEIPEDGIITKSNLDYKYKPVESFKREGLH